MALPEIVRIRETAGGTDQYGDPIAGTSTRTVLPGVFVGPRTTEELDANGRQGVIVGLTIYGPYDTDLTHLDRIEVGGHVYEVEGEVGRWLNPFTGWEAGMTAALRRVEG